MGQFFKYALSLLTYSDTGNEAIDEFIWLSSTWLEIAAIIGIAILIARNEPLRSHRRHEDRFIFFSCILVMLQNILQLLLIPLVEIDAGWAVFVFYASLTLIEALYLFNVLQWLVFVDPPQIK